MFGSTYAVSWEGAGQRCAGRLDVSSGALVLTGARDGCQTRERVPFGEIAAVDVQEGRLRVNRRNGQALWIRSLDAPGALRELAERIAACVV